MSTKTKCFACDHFIYHSLDEEWNHWRMMVGIRVLIVRLRFQSLSRRTLQPEIVWCENVSVTKSIEQKHFHLSSLPNFVLPNNFLIERNFWFYLFECQVQQKCPYIRKAAKEFPTPIVLNCVVVHIYYHEVAYTFHGCVFP